MKDQIPSRASRSDSGDYSCDDNDLNLEVNDSSEEMDQLVINNNGNLPMTDYDHLPTSTSIVDPALLEFQSGRVTENESAQRQLSAANRKGRAQTDLQLSPAHHQAQMLFNKGKEELETRNVADTFQLPLMICIDFFFYAWPPRCTQDNRSTDISCVRSYFLLHTEFNYLDLLSIAPHDFNSDAYATGTTSTWLSE